MPRPQRTAGISITIILLDPIQIHVYARLNYLISNFHSQCSFVEHRNYKIVYRRYASLFFLVGVDDDENELAILEFIHLLVETMDRHFGNVCELDIMFHLEKAHFMLEEMVMNGCIVETSKSNILTPIQLMDKTS
ncbi:AP-4 complex subunit sigma isoform B [Glycine soja]|uniref:AP-4 complex subunit sigma isoform B n=1 Tax=Glycine soja TaxID=3848 RepID=A0A445LWY2_GLYSO|nr:AP-4 complex subunit sigma isoform B [Glycine soja]